MRSTTKQFAQCYIIIAQLQHSKLNTVHLSLSSIGTLHWLRICMVAQLHALSAQQNKYLLSVQFS